MNDYMIYVNGILMPPQLFAVRGATSATLGKFVQATVGEEAMRDACEGMKKIKSVDVIEVRASKPIKRYRYEKEEEGGDDNMIKMAANEETKDPARVRFRCMGVPNSF